MPSRTYAQIETSLKSSKKMQRLPSHKAKWAYLCVHLSDYCTYTGLFRYPLHVWAHDAQMSVEEIRTAIDALCEAGLIDFDAENEFVRIVGWFHKRSGPDNPNRVDSVISDLSGFDDVDPVMYCKSVSELAASSVKRSLRWKQDGAAQAQLYVSLKRFLPEVFQDFGDQFLEAIADELGAVSQTVGTELTAIFPPLAINRSKGSARVPPAVAEHETRRDGNETNTKKDKNETADFHGADKMATWDARQIEEMQRESRGPNASTLNSPLAQSARTKP